MYLHFIFFTIILVTIAQVLQDPAITDTSAGDPWDDSLLQNGASGHLFDRLAALPVKELYLPGSNMVSSESESQSNRPLPAEPGDGSEDFQTAEITIAGCSTPQPPGRKLRARKPQSGGLCPYPQSQGKPFEETPLQEKPVEGIPLRGTTLQWKPFGVTPVGWDVEWPSQGEDNSRNPQFYPSQKDQTRVATRLDRKQCEKNTQTYCCGGPEEPHPRGTLNVNDCVWCMFITSHISNYINFCVLF